MPRGGSRGRKGMPNPKVSVNNVKRAKQVNVVEIRLFYGFGMSRREIAEALGLTEKIVHRAMRLHGIAARPRGWAAFTKARQKPRSLRAVVGYEQCHLRVAAARGKPKECQHCGTFDPARRYEWANLTGNYLDIWDYARLCRSCHAKMDAERRMESGAPTMPEAELQYRRSLRSKNHAP